METSEDLVMRRDGKMLMKRGNTVRPMQEDIAIFDGTRVMMDGIIILADGIARMMMDGETLSMDGKISDMQAKRSAKSISIRSIWNRLRAYFLR